MNNPYIIILLLFTCVGFMAMIWGWRIIQRGKQTLAWPQTPGLIERAELNSEQDDLPPNIEFSYSINEQPHYQRQEFSRDITPTREFGQQIMQKYPIGSTVMVYYNPANPDQATLEPGPAQGDWLVFALGLGMFLVGLLLLMV